MKNRMESSMGSNGQSITTHFIGVTWADVEVLKMCMEAFFLDLSEFRQKILRTARQTQ